MAKPLKKHPLQNILDLIAVYKINKGYPPPQVSIPTQQALRAVDCFESRNGDLYINGVRVILR